LQEALGVAIMEAMAMQMPVVATRVGGVAELVSDGVDGILVPPGDSDALAQALAALARRLQLALRVGAAGRRKVAEGFSSRSSASVIAALVDGHA
jgi:glycosyltransferase involved in cell wall biosynthesis